MATWVPESIVAKDSESPFLSFFVNICSHNQSLNSVVITRSSVVGEKSIMGLIKSNQIIELIKFNKGMVIIKSICDIQL